MRVGGPRDFPPFYFFDDDGHAQGMTLDYLQAIAKGLGLTLRMEAAQPWPQTLAKIKENSIDVIPCIARSNDRESFLLFSRPFLSFPLVIISRSDTPFIGGLDDLRGMRVATIRGNVINEWLEKDKVSIISRSVGSPLEALQSVSEGKADATIDNLAAASYQMDKRGLANLKIAAPTPYGNYDLHLGVRQDWPELLRILDKALDALSPEQHAEIRGKWLSVRYEYGISPLDVIKWLFVAIAPTLLLLWAVLSWNRRLRREIRGRKWAEEALKTSEANFRTFFDSMQDMIVVGTPEGRVLYANDAIKTALGYSCEELDVLGMLGVHPADRRGEAEEIFAAMFRGERISCPLPLQRKDGSLVPVETRVSFGKWNGMDCVFGISKDLTAEQEAQQRFERLFRGNPAPMALSSLPDRRFSDVNDAFLKVLGYDRQAVIGKTSTEIGLFPNADQHKALADLLESEGSVKDFELDVRARDGSTRTGLFSGEVVLSQDRRYFLTVMIDITARKRAEAQLRLQSLVLDQIHDGVTVTDVKGVITYVNNAAAQSLGFSRDELIGVSVEKYGDDSERGASQRQIVEETLEQGKWRGEVVNQTVDGKEVIFDCRTQVVLDEEGNKVALAGIATNVTARKVAEDELRRREALLQKIFEILPVGLWLVDRNGQLLRGNPAGIRIWGAEPHLSIPEYGAFKAWRLPSGEPIAADDWALAKTIREGATIVDELLEIEGFDGKKRTILNYTAPILDDSGGVDGAIVVNLDISKLQDAEKRLVHAQKMEVVGQLAGGTAHDFNNLLQVIQANLELTQQGIDGDRRILPFVESAMSAVLRGAKLSQQLLSFSRKQILNPETVDPNEQIDGIVELLRRTLGEDIEIATVLAADCPAVRIDPHGLENAILNLSVNARAAMPKGGTLTIRTGVRLLDDKEVMTEDGALPAGAYVEISVSDTGCGMPPEVLAHAFEPFFSTKEIGEGSGLGLSMVYGFVRQSDGHVAMESEVGKGTTVRLLFPALAAKAETAREKLDKEPVAGVGTILLVEDDPDVRHSVVMLLETMGYNVLCGENAAAALEILDRQSGIDLLFTDMVMPGGMGGLDLAREASLSHPDLRVLLTSGYPEKALEGVGDFPLLGKPYSSASLREAVRAALAR